MKTINKHLSHLALLAGLLAASSVAFGADADPAVTKTTALAPKVPAKERTAKIQLNEVTAIAAQKGWLREEYAKVNARVELVNVTSFGVSGVEASLLDRGDLHITSRMAYPALQHRANGLDAVVIWEGANPNPRRATTMVLADSNIKSVADLKGKTFGSSLIGCPYYAGREAIKAQGLDVDTEFQKGDIRFVNITGVGAVSAFLAGRIDAYGTHPAISSSAPLYIQNQVREITAAVPDGAYVTAGGRSMYFAMRKWSQENPDLVRAFLVAWDRTVRWLNSDNGAHWEEAAQIAARELREPKAVALYDLHDESTIVWSWGVTDYKDVVDSIERFQSWAISVKDPFYTKHHLSNQEVEAFVDKRFFAGGEYFVDTSKNPKNSAQATATPPVDAKAGVQLAQAGSSR
jgi:sulfonate transport system substrate-binding protein